MAARQRNRGLPTHREWGAEATDSVDIQRVCVDLRSPPDETLAPACKTHGVGDIINFPATRGTRTATSPCRCGTRTEMVQVEELSLRCPALLKRQQCSIRPMLIAATEVNGGETVDNKP